MQRTPAAVLKTSLFRNFQSMRAQGSTGFMNHAVWVMIANERQALTARDNSSHLRYMSASSPHCSADPAPTGPPARLSVFRVHTFAPPARLCVARAGDAISRGVRRRTGGAPDRFQRNVSLPKRAPARDRRPRFSTFHTSVNKKALHPTHINNFGWLTCRSCTWAMRLGIVESSGLLFNYLEDI